MALLRRLDEMEKTNNYLRSLLKEKENKALSPGSSSGKKHFSFKYTRRQ